MPTHHQSPVRRHTIRSVVALGLATLAACKAFDVTDPNNPALEALRAAPTRSLVTTATTGIEVAARTGIAGLHSQLGILGRETYLLSSDDPRFVTELLIGPLQGGSFGGGHWAARYANIRNENIVLDAVDKVASFTAAERAGIKGFAKTIQALDLFEVIVTRDAFGAPIDVNLDPTAAPAPIASRQEVYNRIVTLLNDAQTDLQSGGTAFAFPLSACFAGFNTPGTFIKFNRALRARVAMYLNDFQGTLTALQGSFIDAAGSLNLGAYHCFGTASGDVQNGNYDPTGRSLRAHASFLANAARRADNTLDLRAQTKVAQAEKPLTAQNVSSDKLVTVYSGPADSIAIIRNEELILLRAEANVGLNNLTAAVTDINVIRTRSGGLAAYAGPVTQAALLDEVLYNKRYSLFFEGHRWADLRRYNRLAQLPRDLPTHRIFTQWPFPLVECQAREESTGACAAVTGIP